MIAPAHVAAVQRSPRLVSLLRSATSRAAAHVPITSIAAFLFCRTREGTPRNAKPALRVLGVALRWLQRATIMRIYVWWSV